MKKVLFLIFASLWACERSEKRIKSERIMIQRKIKIRKQR